ncbi:MAG: electron transport complex subunit RsxC [Acidobacteria bacterium]|nr:MAG: electron transport complex subunit RsxC [Acidobacteriota bacterium]
MAALRRTLTFRHGVHPDEHKEATCRLPIQRMPFVDEYVLPLSQHIGRPAKPVVRPGQRVQRGELIAEPDGFVSSAVHSPVTGTVAAIEMRPHPTGRKMEAIVVRADPFASQRFVRRSDRPREDMEPDEIVAAIQRAGIVGLGGAAFPSHVKLKVPPGKRVRFAILNGCECEPYLTADHRTMAERPRAVLRGLELIMKVTGAERGYIGVEVNKPDAIARLREEIPDGMPITVVPLAVKYPQGAEKALIDAIFHKEVPTGKLPLDLEIVVQNVGTAAAIADLFATGQPLIERVVTVSGPGVRRPANLLVPIGTPVRAVLEHCGGLLPSTRQVVLGGPMMGHAQKDLDVPVVKGTSGVIALDRLAPVTDEQPCIRCGRCLEACPMFLNPSLLATLARAERVADLKEHHILDCYECASCSFVCPSHIPLVQLMRVGKALVRERGSN